MLNLRRVYSPEDDDVFQIAHWWMSEQPALYAYTIGIDEFAKFANRPANQIDFSLEQDGKLLALASLVLKRKGVCEFELITPPRPRIRPILALLRQLQSSYFTDLGFTVLYADYPDDPIYEPTKNLVRLFGWRESRLNYFEYTILDFLRSTNGKRTETSSDALRAKH